jgi:hypothetical protein
MPLNSNAGVPDDVIDPDDVATWPLELRDWVQRQAAARDPAAATAGDLGWDLVEREAELRALLGPRKVLAYHCTRLTAHEADDIRASGLRRLSPELVEKRLRDAHSDGLLSDEVYAQLASQSVYVLNEDANRDGQVCLIAGKRGLDDVPGCALLLGLWGGEAIYWGHADGADAPRLGTPTIVVARIDASLSGDILRVFPGLAHLFVATWLGVRERNCDVHLRAAVAGEDILDLWQPGHPDYDRHLGLPR